MLAMKQHDVEGSRKDHGSEPCCQSIKDSILYAPSTKYREDTSKRLRKTVEYKLYSNLLPPWSWANCNNAANTQIPSRSDGSNF